MNEETIFLGALERGAAERDAYLAAACGNNPTLRQRVEELLPLHEQAGSFLEQPPADLAPTQVPATVADGAGATAAGEGPGTLIGRYTLAGPLGEGGMGTVFRAEQCEPVRRAVALKLIKRGMDSAHVLARFEAERQALALMDHPNIARVLDGGATADGRPFFVMELVEGVPITRFCDEHRPTVRQRLELFVSVCRAVQHAHQKGVLHRDLKPSNVLVAVYDGRPVAKVIDFGIAKALQESLTERTLETGLGAVLGTPEYMSPEQAGLNPHDVDTRSDVYALGALLYELLTGTTPLGRASRQGVGLLEVLRRVREEEPPSPSRRLGAGPAARAVRGELDWITMKALEKDRERRYETAGALADDVSRHLADEPVSAGPPSRRYRFRKFARRHRAALATARAFVAVLAAAAGVSAWQAVVATRARGDADRQRAAAEARLDLAADAVGTYLDAVTEDEGLRNSDFHALRKRLLESAVPFQRRLAEERPGDARQQAARGRACARLGRIYYELGAHAQALEAVEERLAVARRLAADHPDEIDYRREQAQASLQRGVVLRQLGRHDEAKQAHEEALRLCEATIQEKGDDRRYLRDLADAQNNLAVVLKAQGDLSGAGRLFGEAADHYGRAAEGAADDSRDRDAQARALTNLGEVWERSGNRAGAREALEKAVRLRRELLARSPRAPERRRDLAATCNTMGIVLWATRDLPGSRQAHEEALELRTRLAAEFASVPGYRQDQAASHLNLGAVLRALKDLTGARQHLEASHAIKEKLAKDFPLVPHYRRDLALSHTQLGALLADLDDKSAARQAFEEGLRVRQELAAAFPGLPDYRKDVVAGRANLGIMLERLGDGAAALAAFREAADEADRLVKDYPQPAAYPVIRGHAHYLVAERHRQDARYADALAAYDRAIDALPQTPLVADGVDGRSALSNSYRGKAQSLHGLGRHDEAEPVWEQAQAQWPPEVRSTLRNERATALWRAGRFTASAAVVDEVVRAPETTPPQVYDAACVLALVAEDAKGGTDEAAARERYAARCVELLRLAQAKGFFQNPAYREHFRTNPDFGALREREDFRNLLAELNGRLK